MKNAYQIIILLLISFSQQVSAQHWKQYADSAKVYDQQENLDKAIEFYINAMEELKKDSASTITYAEICNDLANLYGEKDEFEKAEPLFLEAKQIREKVLGKQHPHYAASCHNLGRLYGEMVQYRKAESFYLEARQIRKITLGKDHPDYATTCNYLGALYVTMGQYDKAEPVYLEAKQIREKVLGKEHPHYANSCNNLAILYNTMGQYEKAEPLYLEAKQIREKVLGKEHLLYAQSCNNLAILYLTIGQYQKAEFFHLEGKQITERLVGKEHYDYANSCNNLAIVYLQTEQYSKAELLLLEAKQIREKVFGKEHPLYANTCNILAILYTKMGQYQEAEPYYLEAKQIRKKLFGNEHHAYGKSCDDLAVLYTKMGKFKKAETLLLEAKQIMEKVFGKEHPEYTSTCNNLAIVYWNLHQTTRANELYSKSFNLQNNQVNKIFLFTSEVEKQSYLKKTAYRNNYSLSFLATSYDTSTQGLSYNMSLFSRNLILSSSQRLRQTIYSSPDTSIKNKYNTWMDAREQLSFWYTKPVPQRPGYIKDLEERSNNLEKELTRFSSTFKQEQAQSAITWKDIQHKLKSNEAAIEFVHFNYFNGRRMTDSTYYVALVLKKDQIEPTLIPLFESRQLTKLLGAGNTLNTISTLYQSSNKPVTAYSLIWKPIEKQLKGITKIYFAPAGLLHRISFAALPFDDRLVLSDKYQLVQFNTTANVVSQAERFVVISDKLTLYGGIQYDADSLSLKQEVVAFHSTKDAEPTRFLTEDIIRGSTWQYLPGTEKEINEIITLGKQKNYSLLLASGVAASEESLKALNGKYSPSVLHIATHGFFFPDPKEIKKSNSDELTAGNPFKLSDDPLFRSGLLFAGANNAWSGKPVSGVEDGILTAYEVSNLYLPKTKLVVLSACETGLGDIQGNEGVYGLQRAFKMAGVEYLVMSLWKVPDKTTAEFMQEFYKGIFDKQTVNDAFYNAQTIMKNRYKKEPYKWAAWVLIR